MLLFGGIDGRLAINTVGISWLGCIETSLDKVLAFSLGDKRLQLWSCEGIDETGL